MKKTYEATFKMKVVSEYLKGVEGYALLAKKYGVPDKSQIRKWVNQYQQYGIQGFEKKQTKKCYTGTFKLEVLHFKKRTGASLKETSNHFGISEPSIISTWEKKFQEGGAKALSRRKGRPPTMEKKQKRAYRKKPMTREQELERENELLKIEIEYLKKLRAFQQNPALLGKRKP
ncbi:helix-turn-helix domain-containing protein [Shimazuella sp. AN120528]|uniref:helix-turn-helix domain-containing protein n=1 Tax=Shimazuella soli TaxID=1892854 RepID=UPI001F0D8C32|nr:helix-turn-helix domain-containing protein [Shimazuella soli]MCH5584318.1 helix-turn-helix domain-containing protein [Shimazuella soli]